MSRIRLPAKIENLAILNEFVCACAKEHGFSGKRIGKVELATEEILVNIFNYAYPHPHTGDVEIRCKRAQDDAFIVEIVDTGISFHIESIGEPDINASVSDRKIGGLGIFLARKMADAVQRRRDGDMNIVTLTFRREKGA
jgi:serine/threonine-protein kinase RsbW